MNISDYICKKSNNQDPYKMGKNTLLQLIADYICEYEPKKFENIQYVMKCELDFHTTIGLYNSGSYVVNGVRDANLAIHIYYNILKRPGRAFFVNGKCINSGYPSDTELAAFETKIQSNPHIFIKKNDTAPYI